MKQKYIYFILTFFVCVLAWAAEPSFKILAIADIQYADKDTHKTRFYRNSIQKLEKIRAQTADKKFEFLINLGDTVDALHANLAAPLAELKKFNLKTYNLMGNHDYADKDANVELIKKDLNLDKSTHYSFDVDDWRFIVLDTNTLSTYYKPSKKFEAEYSALYEKLTAQNARYAKPWNGGVDNAQMIWLEGLLKQSLEDKKNVIIFAHHPVLPIEGHVALNTSEIVGLTQKYSCVKAYINGHNHLGNYAVDKGVHYLTICGLIEDEDIVSYAILEVYPNKIEVIGFGKTPSRTLEFSK